MKRTRAERRANKEKYRNKTRRIVKNWESFEPPHRKRTDEEIEQTVIKIEKHRKSCSCIICRNEKFRDERTRSTKKCKDQNGY